MTAEHVISALDAAQAQCERLVCLLRTAVLDLPAALIDRNETLDIATFRVTEEQLAESGPMAIDCRADWPPPLPEQGDALSIGALPEALKVAAPHDHFAFHGYVHMGRVDDLSDRIAEFRPERGDQRLRAAPSLPETGGNFSGCSGGPVLLHLERGGIHRWFPVGLVVVGPGEPRDGGFEGLDYFQLRRIHFVRPDGSIGEPAWRPDMLFETPTGRPFEIPDDWWLFADMDRWTRGASRFYPPCFCGCQAPAVVVDPGDHRDLEEALGLC